MYIGEIKGEIKSSPVDARVGTVVDTIATTDISDTGSVSVSSYKGSVSVSDTRSIISETNIHARVRWDDNPEEEATIPIPLGKIGVFKEQKIIVFYVEGQLSKIYNLNTNESGEYRYYFWCHKRKFSIKNWLHVLAVFLISFIYMMSLPNSTKNMDIVMTVSVILSLVVIFITYKINKIRYNVLFNKKIVSIYDRFINTYKRSRGQLDDYQPLSIELISK